MKFNYIAPLWLGQGRRLKILDVFKCGGRQGAKLKVSEPVAVPFFLIINSNYE